MIDTNLRGYLHAISAVLPGMTARRSGHILNLSSVAGIRVGDAGGVYSATKFFIHGITDSLRQEVVIAQDLNAGAIHPGRVADAVVHALDQPTDVTVNDIVIHPTRQNR